MPLQLRTEKHTKHYIEQLDRGREHWQTWCDKVHYNPNMEDIKELDKQVAKYADQHYQQNTKSFSICKHGILSLQFDYPEL